MSLDYARYAETYDAVRANDGLDREFWLAALVDVGRLAKGERILDLGAGTGRFARLVAEFADVVAFDLSREMLLQAHRKGSFPLVRGDAHALPFRNDAFDATTVVMVIHQLRDVTRALREVARVSRRVVIATTDIRMRSMGILEEAFPSLLAIDRGRFPNPEDLAPALRAAGYLDVRLERRSLRRTLTVAEELDRVRRKYISTLDLLPPGEFERGLGFLERELPLRHADAFVTESTFTFVGASR